MRKHSKLTPFLVRSLKGQNKSRRPGRVPSGFATYHRGFFAVVDLVAKYLPVKSAMAILISIYIYIYIYFYIYLYIYKLMNELC